MADVTIVLFDVEAAAYESIDEKVAARAKKRLERRVREQLRGRLFTAEVRAENGRLIDLVGVRMR